MRTTDDVKGSPASPTNADGKTAVALVVAFEGKRDLLEVRVASDITVSGFAKLVADTVHANGSFSVFLENGNKPLDDELLLLPQLPSGFTVLHVGRNDEIKVTFHFNGRDVVKAFKPSSTIRSLTVWVVGPDGFNLEGTDSDYQLKHDGTVLEPDLHLGQIAHSLKEINLDLVLKVKAQG